MKYPPLYYQVVNHCFFLFLFVNQVKQILKRLKNKKKKPEKNFVILMKWFFSHFGLHRTIELIFLCDRCQKKIYMCMHKTQEGKQLTIHGKEIQKSKIFYSLWIYIPKNKINYDYCEKYFDEASGDLTILSNNCKDFANYIWKNIKKLDRKMNRNNIII